MAFHGNSIGHKGSTHWQPGGGPYNPVIDSQGGHAVNLTLRFDLLAVCAVFVFVGAILLGAF
jgi:hypothetical protein